MRQGFSFIELMLSITLASLLVLGLYAMNNLFTDTYTELRRGWYCMQSLRNTVLFLNRDLRQCGYLLPQDLKLAEAPNQLFLAGTPLTSQHSGLHYPRQGPPPCFAIVTGADAGGLRLDTVDIDGNAVPDFWADLGLITESGAYVIAHSYRRGGITLPLTSTPEVFTGERAVPAIHYELKKDGLYRNNQLLAEAISTFQPTLRDTTLSIHLKARAHAQERALTFDFPID